MQCGDKVHLSEDALLEDVHINQNTGLYPDSIVIQDVRSDGHSSVPSFEEGASVDILPEVYVEYDMEEGHGIVEEDPTNKVPGSTYKSDPKLKEPPKVMLERVNVRVYNSGHVEDPNAGCSEPWHVPNLGELVRRCCIRNCFAEVDWPNCAFRQFPNTLWMRKKWARSTGRADFRKRVCQDSMGRGDWICEHHFEPNDVRLERGRKVFRPGAIPRIFRDVYQRFSQDMTDNTITSALFKSNEKIVKVQLKLKKEHQGGRTRTAKNYHPSCPEIQSLEQVKQGFLNDHSGICETKKDFR